MCGIVGFFDIHDKPFDQVSDDIRIAVKNAMTTMQSRGPDDEGVFSAPGIIMGHKRLSIIDIVGGTQPMVDKANGVTLVYNGEIFNFRELRCELKKEHHTFMTNSDTEVLLHAYLQWGVDCVHHISGMFAFAVFDKPKNRLFIARDRLGIKPLFYHINKKTIAFASTSAAIACFPSISKQIDMPALSHYLTTIRTTFGRTTLFKDIKTLLPGEYLIAEQGHTEPMIKRYWDIPMIAPADKNSVSISDASQRVYGLVTESISEQLISDVPLGGFLSGGIDSSILASLASTKTNGNFNAYSIGYDKKGYNEWPFVREAANYHKMTCNEIHIDESEFPETWKMLIRSKGAPISTPNEIAIYHLSAALKQDFTVALSGEGADEIFGGYVTPYFSAYDYERARRSPPQTGTNLSDLDSAMQRIYKRPYLLCRPDHYFLINSWVPFQQKRQLFNNAAWDSLNQDSALFDFYESWFEQLKDCSTFDAYMQIHFRINLEGLLSRVDSSTMAASVEARVPFSNHKIAEYLFTLPDNLKMQWKNEQAKQTAKNLNISEIDKQQLITSKVLLRKAFKNEVPPSIMTRPKVSFPVPFLEWFAEGKLIESIEDTIRNSNITKQVFSTKYVNKILTTTNQTQSAMALWPLANLCLWEQECGAKLTF